MENENFNVVNIGANNGKTGDFLYELIHLNSNWKVLFVEPVPYLFEELKSNFINNESRFYFENIAINDGSEQFFYTVKKEILLDKKFPDWAIQLSSFDKNNILKHLGNDAEKFIDTKTIKGIDLISLLQKYQLQPDIIQIDTEGYDWKILSQYDLTNSHISIILFEKRHLSESEITNAMKNLSEKYKVFCFDEDLLCIHQNLLNKNNLSKRELEILFKFEFK